MEGDGKGALSGGSGAEVDAENKDKRALLSCATLWSLR